MNVNQNGVSAAADAQRENARLGQACPTTRDRYTYDGQGTLPKREHLIQGAGGWTTQSSTVYIGGIYEKTNTGEVTKYYSGLGRTVAIRQVPSGSGAGSLYYPILDHLGGTIAVLDSSGAIVSSQKYWPYGATRSGGVTQTDKQG